MSGRPEDQVCEQRREWPLNVKDSWLLDSPETSWLRRLPYTKSIKGELKREEVGKLCFCPVNSNMEDLEKAKMSIKNPVWKDIYCALLKCRTNYVTLHPEEFLTILVNKEPELTANFTGLQQGWSNHVMLYQVLDNEGNLCTLDNLRTPKRPLKMEYDEFEKTTRKRLEIHSFFFIRTKFIRTLRLRFCSILRTFFMLKSPNFPQIFLKSNK